MPDNQAKPDPPTSTPPEVDLDGIELDADALAWLVERAFMDGNLEALIAHACEEALATDLPPEVDPDRARHAGARAAIEAYAAWKAAEGPDVPIDVLRPEPWPAGEPEVLPLALMGKWVAWSAAGLKIVAAAKTIEEAERLAAEAGEPEPIMERHMGPCRL